MRLFTAIELDANVQDAAASLVEALQRRARAIAPQSRLTWAEGARMHLTLRFIGEVGESAAEQVISVMREPLPVAPFDVTFDGFGAFPGKGEPRVIWVAIASGRDRVMEAESLVSDRLAAAGIGRDSRPFRPHLTLARVRDAAGLRAATLCDGLSSRLGTTRVEAITLFQSRLSPKGSSYTALERTPLRL